MVTLYYIMSYISFLKAFFKENTMSFTPLSSSSFSCGKSWVSSELMTRKICHFSELKICDNWVLWCERRPEEQGRFVIIGYNPQGFFIDLVPQDASVGSSVNEYGGGAWCARSFEKNGEKQIEIIFHDRIKGGIWRSIMGAKAEMIVPKEWKGEIYAYADFSCNEDKIFCVRESHHHPIKMDIVIIDLDKNIEIIAQNADFYAAPRPSPDGQFIAWIEWNNPHMPWDCSALYVAPLSDTQKRLCLEGKDDNISVMEPFWGSKSELYALSDSPSSFKNLEDRHWTPIGFAYTLSQKWEKKEIKPSPFEIGFPQWVFGQSSYHVFPNGEILAVAHKEGKQILLAYQKKEENEQDKQWKEIAFRGEIEMLPQNLTPEKSLEESCYCWINQSEKTPPFIAKSSLTENENIISLKAAWMLPKDIKEDDISQPQFISYKASDGVSPLYALFYPPAKGAQTCSIANEGDKPPLMVLVHGGPTAQAQRAFSFKVQWWTSRGFAVLDVNYRGSTGFGRAYRDALNGQWGKRDVEDCCDGVRYLQNLGLVDKKRTVIRGSSAGGLTVLSALAHCDLFAGGTSLYGVTDLSALARDTHRFEAYYLEKLVGPYPQARKLYQERSPLSWAEKIKVPVFFFHGGQDRVVPLEHAQRLYKQLPHASYHIYPEEGHGFKNPNIQADMFQRELEFYLNLFNL